jgi:two-component system, chemotaxis family, response regulator Rcp1
MPLQVLLVEDSPGDLRLTQEAFRDVNPFIRMHLASDGVEAMAFLKREGKHAQASRPDLILLDLNLPKMDGRQVLALIKEDDRLKTIPTVILTSSEAEADVVKSYQLQANCYLSKPMHFEAFHALVKSINDFWLTRVKLPQRSQSEQPENDQKACPSNAKPGDARRQQPDFERSRLALPLTDVPGE